MPVSTLFRGDRVSLQDAACAMSEFIWRFGERAKCNDLVTLLGDTDISGDGQPMDPAAWFDWLASVDWVQGGNSPQTGNDPSGKWWLDETRTFDPIIRTKDASDPSTLSVSEGFMSMIEYVWRVADRVDEPSVPEVLMTLPRRDTPVQVEPFWSSWLDCVDWIRSGNAPQTGP